MSAKISIQIYHSTETLFLLESNIIGRSNTLGPAKIDIKTLPEFWLEIRYFTNQWYWRALEGKDKTKGSGKFVAPNWRQFSAPIKFGQILTLTLIDDQAPKPLWENLKSHQRGLLETLQGCVPHESGFTVQSMGAPLRNGDVFVLQNNTYKAWIPVGIDNTLDENISVNNLEHIDIDLERLVINITGKDDNGIVYQGEGARILAAYLMALREQSGQWVRNDDVYPYWIELGGNQSSKVERINWERNKLCRTLFKLGLMGTQDMFEKARQGKSWYMRLNIPLEKITIC